MARRRPGTTYNWKFVLGVIVGMVPALVFGGGQASAFMLPIDGGQESKIVAGEPLYIYPNDTQYLNRIFTERDHEIGYCVSINGDQLSFWLADTVKASEESLTMKTSSCPPEMRDATAHTHPNGRIALSDEDRSTLFMSDQNVICIHAGKLEMAPGAELDNLVCYKDAGHEKPVLINVRVTQTND